MVQGSGRPAAGTPGPADDPPSRLEFRRVRVALVNAHRSARTQQAWRESVLVRWETADGAVGWAECPTLTVPGYVTETTDMAWSALVNELGPSALAGRSPNPVGAPAAAAAMLDADLDARLRAAHVSLPDWLARRTRLTHRSRVPWCAVLADVDHTAEEAVAGAVEAVAEGAAMVKAKVTGGTVDAVAGARSVLAAVRDAVAVPVAADANGTLTADDVALIDDLGLAYLEQPLPAGTPWVDLAALCAATATPVALDESLTSLDAVHDAVLAGAVDVVSVKPARMGGCVAAAAAVALASSRGVPCFVGGMFELGIGRAAALAVASLDVPVAGNGDRSVGTLPTDLGPSARYVAPDICEPIVSGPDGPLVVPHGAGSGREPDVHVLEACTIDRLVLGG